ncbi:MAG: hypothetical protein IKU07_06570 [Oscillospiraceae bacterium]|nr:hypothetical protein [Oscillospiraceae bacterium]
MWKRFLASAAPFWKQLFEKRFVTVDNTTVIVFVLSLFLVPYPWVFGWVLAVCAHELSHLFTLFAVGVPVAGIRFGANGAKIDTLPLTDREELICAAAGPLGGFLLAILCFEIPYIGYCALAQSLFNLLPIYPMDGGRIFRIVCCRLFGNNVGKLICRIVNLLVPLIIVTVIFVFYKTKCL